MKIYFLKNADGKYCNGTPYQMSWTPVPNECYWRSKKDAFDYMRWAKDTSRRKDQLKIVSRKLTVEFLLQLVESMGTRLERFESERRLWEQEHL